MSRVRRFYAWMSRPAVVVKVAVVGASLLAFVTFLSTLQLDINGSRSHYATDVGEIQNALPRWGIIHFNGYPLYSMLGSVFVTVFRLLGVQPATSASLFSAIWGAIGVGVLVALILFFEVPPSVAAVVAFLFALSTSVWVDASIAEVHTMTVALTFGTLLAALHFRRSGQRRDLFWLAFLAGQVIAHQPASVLLLPALAVLISPQWRSLFRLWRALPVALGLALLGPLTYLYLPIRVWQGADWVFSSPDTWAGFRSLALDDKSYIVVVPRTLGEWLDRGVRVFELLAEDWPLFLLGLGLLGLFCLAWRKRWIEMVGLHLAWVPYLALAAIIWEGRVSDALLAAKLPVVMLAALGIALLIGTLASKWRWLGVGGIALCLVAVGFVYAAHRPKVLEVTRDPGAKEIISMAARIQPAADGQPVVLTSLWGVDYFALAYAQEYQGMFPDVRLVKHDANFRGVLERGEHLVTLEHTFYPWPLETWRSRLGGRLYLSSFAPGIIEMNTRPPLSEADVPPASSFFLDNGIIIRHADLSWTAPDVLVLTVYWQAERDGLEDHSIAVHLVSRDPPTGPQDILLQADRDHPLWGWYPVSQWTAGEIVRDHYLLQVPAGPAPKAVRVNMYQSLGDGQFRNTAWLSIPVPAYDE
jgi:hypothetical protein